MTMPDKQHTGTGREFTETNYAEAARHLRMAQNWANNEARLGVFDRYREIINSALHIAAALSNHGEKK